MAAAYCGAADMSCEPLRSVQQVLEVAARPPAWRVLCRALRPHSHNKIRNDEVTPGADDLQLENPLPFCHFNPDAPEPPRYPEGELPRTLLCHDMANGYHHDRFLEGSKAHDAYTFYNSLCCRSLLCHDMAKGYHRDRFVEGSTAHDAYTFYNWAGIDIFCYFSHHFVTVPPLGWINAAHAHGVKVIGTIITEHSEGEEVWDELLASEARQEQFIAGLVAVARALTFDGWLLNVENKVHAPARLVAFVAALHRALHAALPHAQLIWYDAVTADGRLHWQNALTEHNKAFFDACDGLFTNYSWSEAQVAESAAFAGARRRDLYVGVDVWGRNFIGGGKFNVQQAVSIAHRAGCSVAIFAPAWTHESLDRERSGTEADKIERGHALDFYDRFLLRDRAMWDSLWPLLYTRLPTQLPFRTACCRGQGPRRRLYGEVISPGPWYNLRHTEYQPNATHGPHGYLLSTKENIKKVSHSAQSTEKLALPHLRTSLDALVKHRASRHATRNNEDCVLRLAYVGDELPCLEVYHEDSFLGGSCLKVNPSDAESPDHRWIRLLHTEFLCEESLVVCVVTKLLGDEGQALDVVLRGVREGPSQGGEEPASVTLLGDAAAQASPYGSCRLLPLLVESARFRTLRRHLLLLHTDFYVPTDNLYGWDVRYYEVDMPGLTVQSINLRTRNPTSPLLLGLVGVCPWSATADRMQDQEVYVDQAM